MGSEKLMVVVRGQEAMVTVSLVVANREVFDVHANVRGYHGGNWLVSNDKTTTYGNDSKHVARNDAFFIIF